jgi:hypothetical protein
MAAPLGDRSSGRQALSGLRAVKDRLRGVGADTLPDDPHILGIQAMFELDISGFGSLPNAARLPDAFQGR